MTRRRSPPSTGWTGLVASLATVPSSGAVMAASIFMASMVATGLPAVDGVALRHLTGSRRRRTGRRHGPGSRGRPSRRSATSTSTLGRAPDRAQLAVEGAHHGAHAALVGVADRLERRGAAARPGSSRRACSCPCLQAVEEVAGGEHGRRRRRRRGGRSKSLVGPGNSSRLRRAPRLVRPGRARPRRSGAAGGLGRAAPCQRLGAERLGPAARRVAELAAQEADHRVGDVVVVGVAGEVVAC